MAHILIVDDEPDGLQLLEAWLQGQGYSVITSHDGAAALELAQIYQPDLILLDVVMPNMDGITICRKLRQERTTQSIPVLLLTAKDPLESRMAGLRAGADDYLSKPIDFDELDRRIKGLLGGSSAFIAQGERLVDEVLESIIPTLSCNFAWLLTLNSREQALETLSMATSRKGDAVAHFMQVIGNSHAGGLFPFHETRHPLVSVVLMGKDEYNVPMSTIRESGDHDLYRACTDLDIYFLSMLPLQTGRIPLGLLVVGSIEPLDVDTRRGMQLIYALRNQAASTINNARLTRLLAEREAESNRDRTFRQTLLDNMSDGLLVHTRRGDIRYVNKRLVQMMGYGEEDLLSLNVVDLFHPEMRGRVAEAIQNTDEATSLELELINKQGESLSVLMSQAAQPVQDGGDEYVVVITDLSERRAREAALNRQVHHMSAISRTSEVVSSVMETERIIDLILEEARRALNATNAAVIVSGSESPMVQVARGPYADRLKNAPAPAEGTIVAETLFSGQPVLSTAQDDRTYDLDAITGETALSFIAVPLVIHEDLGGVLTVFDAQPDLFDRKDVELLQNLAGTASLAVENTHLYNEAQQRVRELTLLLRASESTSSAFAIEEVMENIAHQLMDTLESDYCLIASWSAEEQTLIRLAETANIHAPDGVIRRMRLGDHPLSEAVIRSGATTIFSTVNEDIPLEAYGTLMNNQLSTLTLVPVVIDGRVDGVIELYDLAQHRRLNRKDLDRIDMMLDDWLQGLPEGAVWHAPHHVQEMCQRLRDISGLGWSTVLYRTEDDQLEIIYEAGKAIWSLEEGPTVGIDENSLFWSALRDDIPFTAAMTDDDLTEADRALLPTLMQGMMVVAPLMARGEAIGMVVVLDTTASRRYSMTELSLMQAIANVTGHALENALLFTELTHRAAQLEMAYNHLREADRIKDEVIQNVSHELRTPLTLIMGYAELLRDGDLGALDEAQAEAVETITEKTQQLAKLVEDILTVRLMESENLRRDPALLNEVAEVAVRSMKTTAERAGVELVTRFEQHHTPVDINKSRMIQVFENLLSNAIKFSSRGSRVEVMIEDDAQMATVRIRDHGIGIAKDEHDKIWWRFYQVDGSTTRQFGGTGLGLAIVKRVVEQHDGRVWVESEPGQGSTFGFVLPTAHVPMKTPPVG